MLVYFEICTQMQAIACAKVDLENSWIQVRKVTSSKSCITRHFQIYQPPTVGNREKNYIISCLTLWFTISHREQRLSETVQFSSVEKAVTCKWVKIKLRYDNQRSRVLNFETGPTTDFELTAIFWSRKVSFEIVCFRSISWNARESSPSFMFGFSDRLTNSQTPWLLYIQHHNKSMVADNCQ